VLNIDNLIFVLSKTSTTIFSVLNVDNHLFVNVGVAHNAAKLFKIDFSVFILKKTKPDWLKHVSRNRDEKLSSSEICQKILRKLDLVCRWKDGCVGLKPGLRKCFVKSNKQWGSGLLYLVLTQDQS
jgi:hypothetical protein